MKFLKQRKTKVLALKKIISSAYISRCAALELRRHKLEIAGHARVDPAHSLLITKDQSDLKNLLQIYLLFDVLYQPVHKSSHAVLMNA